MCLQIPSDKVPFNQLPDMKAYEITEAGKEALRSGKYKMVSRIQGGTWGCRQAGRRALGARQLPASRRWPCLIQQRAAQAAVSV